MRIRRKSPMNTVSASSTSTPSSSLSSHSSITIASSTDSSSSSPSNSSSPATRCCTGLDLLVKAIHHVTSGSAVAVPYIQRRVIRRRRRALRFNKLVVAELFKQEDEEEEEEEEEEVEEQQQPTANLELKRQRRVMGLPTKFQDSVLESWRPLTRRRRSIEIGNGLN